MIEATQPAAVPPWARLRTHALIQCGLILLYFLPGGLLWNRIDPVVLGLPFGVLVTAVILPVLIVLNIVVYVARYWAEDKLVSSEVRLGAGVQHAERKVVDDSARANATGPRVDDDTAATAAADLTAPPTRAEGPGRPRPSEEV